MGDPREVARGAEGYPARLLELPKPPARLFLEGPWDDVEPIVAIVGSRAASGDGVDLAESIAGDLAAAGIAVISGLARGIDAAAHRGALAAGGRSGAVLGTPIDVSYPRAHRDLQRRLASSLGILTEVPPDAPVTPGLFASRNRLLAAMADVVVVVQGREGSGALHTVEAARTLGRPLGAVPWDPREPLGEIPLRLVREGAATLVRDARDIAELIPASGRGARRANRPETATRPSAGAAEEERIRPRFSETEALLLAALRYRAEPLETAASRIGLSIAEAGAALLTLEMARHAVREPGGLVRRRRPAPRRASA
ncbi:MAG TPA: DNA-processing protein DprA [Candidatus Eisenbacteria bacterium]|nr:DNA-processing protein DprA [Candidatus Eisenbacteria bacterium]